MVIPALPTLQRDLNTTTTWVTWVLTVFLLVASVATPILGKLGDQYGKERLLVISLAVGVALFAWPVLAVMSDPAYRSAATLPASALPAHGADRSVSTAIAAAWSSG